MFGRRLTLLGMALMSALMLGVNCYYDLNGSGKVDPDLYLEEAIRDAVAKQPGADPATVTELRVINRGITDLSRLSSLTNLRFLELGGNNMIRDISPLASLANLTFLGIGHNLISDVSPLTSLTNLSSLNLGTNRISDISPLTSLTNLKSLNLAANRISDISPLASLTNLNSLDLQLNQISDISPLVENSGLGEGDEVWLGGNNLDLSEGSGDLEDIRQLQGRGVLIYYG